MFTKEKIFRSMKEQYLDSDLKRPNSVRVQLFSNGTIFVFTNGYDPNNYEIFDSNVDTPEAVIKDLAASAEEIEASLVQIFRGMDSDLSHIGGDVVSSRSMGTQIFEDAVKQAIFEKENVRYTQFKKM